MQDKLAKLSAVLLFILFASVVIWLIALLWKAIL